MTCGVLVWSVWAHCLCIVYSLRAQATFSLLSLLSSSGLLATSALSSLSAPPVAAVTFLPKPPRTRSHEAPAMWPPQSPLSLSRSLRHFPALFLQRPSSSSFFFFCPAAPLRSLVASALPAGLTLRMHSALFACITRALSACRIA